METTQPSPASEPRPADQANDGQPAEQPTTEPSPSREPRSLELSPALKARLEQHYLAPGETVDQLAADAAARRAGHVGRHHFAGHPSARNPWSACGEWRPVAGVSCPVCPDVCPGCGAYYANPFPVDPRDG